MSADGELLVVAPRRVSRRTIDRFLGANADWVQRYVQRSLECLAQTPALRYTDDEAHLFLGRPLLLQCRVEPGLRAQAQRVVRGAEQHLALNLPEHDIERARTALRAWYRTEAGVHFCERLEVIARRAPWVGKVPELRLRRMKRTWGSCSRKGVITLNTHLVKAPPELIDYVVAHEVCHLAEHNHGPGFYRLQDQLNPQWRGQRDRLRSRGHLYLHE